MKKSNCLVAVPLVTFCSTGAAWASGSLTLAIQSSDPSMVALDQVVNVTIKASFDQPLVACSYELSFEGSGGGVVESRTLGPVQSDGVVVVSPISQEPSIDVLPFDAEGSILRETFVDDQFDGTPGGSTDGVAPASNLTIESLSIRMTRLGSLTVQLQGATAVTTQGDPGGVPFGAVDYEPGADSVTFMVCGSEDCNNNSTGDNCDLRDIVKSCGSAVIRRRPFCLHPHPSSHRPRTEFL